MDEVTPQAISAYLVKGQSYPNIFNYILTAINASHNRQSMQENKEITKLIIELYGSLRELMENIAVYQIFPVIQTYQSMKGEQFILKKDVVDMLLNNIAERSEVKPGCFLYVLLAGLLAKGIGMKGNWLEFCKCSTVEVDEVVDEIVAALEKKQPTVRFPKNDFKKFYEHYVAILGPVMSVELLRLHFEPRTSEVLENEYSAFVTLFKTLERIVNLRPYMFPSTKQTAPLKVLRIFEDGDRQFFLPHEYYEALNIAKVDVNWIARKILVTSSLDLANVEVNDKLAEFELIRVPIKRTKHRALPILTSFNVDCLLASDAFFETFRELFHGARAQLKENRSKIPYLLEYFYRLMLYHFSPQVNAVHFVPIDVLNFLTNEIMTSFPKSARPTPIREVDEKGFTLEDLREELRNMSFDNGFGDLISFSESVFKAVDTGKTKESLRTCDLYEAMEQCVLAAVLKKQPEFADFVHIQGACHRVAAHSCLICYPENTTPEFRKQLTIYGDLQGSTSEKGVEKVIPEKVDKLNDKPNEKPEQKPKTAEVQPVSKKQSEACQKCYRTSLKCNAAKQELKELKSSVEKDAKKVRKAERVLAEQKENELRIRKELEDAHKFSMENVEKKLQDANSEVKLLKAKLKAKEKESKKLNADLRAHENLEQEVANLMAQNEQRDFKVSDLSAQLSRANRQIEEKDKIIGILKSKMSTPIDLKLSGKLRNRLLELQNTRDKILGENLVATVSEKIRKFKQMTENEDYKFGADLELKMFRIAYDNFMKALELNIEMIQKGLITNISQIHALPPYPSLPNGFLAEYEKLMSQQKMIDDPCPICLEEFEPSETTVKCEICKKRYHGTCIAKWFEIKKVCTMCARTMRDPKEFPELK